MSLHQQKVHDAARSMIDRYGHRALQQVDQRIRELQEHREEHAVSLWQEIRTAVRQMLEN